LESGAKQKLAQGRVEESHPTYLGVVPLDLSHLTEDFLNSALAQIAKEQPADVFVNGWTWLENNLNKRAS